MVQYQTKFLKNLSTGESLVFVVEQDKILAHENALKWHTENYESSTMARDPKSVICDFEFSLLPSYKQVVKIWTSVSVTEMRELVTRMILDFGCPETFLEKVLVDQDFMKRVGEVLVGITCDGSRAVRSMKVAYGLVASHYSSDPYEQHPFTHMD